MLNVGGTIGIFEYPSVGVYDSFEAVFTLVMAFVGSEFVTDIIIADGAAFAAEHNRIYRFDYVLPQMLLHLR